MSFVDVESITLLYLGKGNFRNYFNHDDVESLSDEDLRKSINDFYDKITPIVSKVENKLMEHSEELMKMKSV